MSPRLRRLALTTHVTSSVGWTGALVAYLALAIVGLIGHDPGKMRAAYFSMELVGWFVIVPFSVASLATGLVESLGTEWGLFKHHWVRTKFALTVVATVVLFVHMRTVRYVSTVAHLPSLDDVRGLRVQMVAHAVGGLVVLLVATALSFYKPWGRTAYGERSLRNPPAQANPNGRRLLYITGAIVLAMVAIMIALHLHDGGVRHH